VRFLRAGNSSLPLPGGPGIDPLGITTEVRGASLKRDETRAGNACALTSREARPGLSPGVRSLGQAPRCERRKASAPRKQMSCADCARLSAMARFRALTLTLSRKRERESGEQGTDNGRHAPFGAPPPFFVAHDPGPKTGRHFSGSCAFVAHDLGPKTGRHFSGSCALEASLKEFVAASQRQRFYGSLGFLASLLAKLGCGRIARTNLHFPSPLAGEGAERPPTRSGGAKRGEGSFRTFRAGDPSPGSSREDAQLATLSRKGEGKHCRFRADERRIIAAGK
jgi:hypothetical protein